MRNPNEPPPPPFPKSLNKILTHALSRSRADTCSVLCPRCGGLLHSYQPARGMISLHLECTQCPWWSTVVRRDKASLMRTHPDAVTNPRITIAEEASP